MKKVPVALIFPHTPECLRLIVKEAVCRKGRTQVHDEVVYRAVPRVNEVGFVLEQFVNALDDVSFPQHDLVPHGHQFVLHLSLEPMNKLDTLTEQALEEFLLVYPLSAKTFPYKTFANTVHTMPSLSSTFAPVRRKLDERKMISV